MNWPFLYGIYIYVGRLETYTLFWDYILWLQFWCHSICMVICMVILCFYFSIQHTKQNIWWGKKKKCLNFIVELPVDINTIHCCAFKRLVRSGVINKSVAYIEWNENRGNLLTNQSKTVSSADKRKSTYFHIVLLYAFDECDYDEKEKKTYKARTESIWQYVRIIVILLLKFYKWDELV